LILLCVHSDYVDVCSISINIIIIMISDT